MWKHKLIKQRCHWMKDDIIRLSHEFEAFSSWCIAKERHHLSPRGEFISSYVFWNENIGSTSKHLQVRDVRLHIVQHLIRCSPSEAFHWCSVVQMNSVFYCEFPPILR